MSELVLYDYWRSSAAYRLRIALNLKGVAFERKVINIAPGADEQFAESYKLVNPQMRVPSIEIDGRIGTQSMAILEWLEETFDGPALLPADPWTRLQVRSFADTIACDIHPLNNLSVLARLREHHGADADAIGDWYRDWIIRGFTALEATVSAHTDTEYLFGDSPTLAEICLVPQVANARRFETELSAFPRLVEIDEKCRALDAFARAAPQAVKPE
ncbi:maleylacetoacetate isomerase [Henriciella litoralis]|uniref:maleylacetoacetate isomerase n=1 Tax=Henriciella litoralis TaxID=568102 RepID=UPI000A05889A|nr:maleylacetoacetate isomerase [Henriciella litoralis]